jgi:hypothetical protein
MYNIFESMTNTYVQKIKIKNVSNIGFEYRERDLENVVGEEEDIEDEIF